MKGIDAQFMGGGAGKQKDQFEKKVNKDPILLQKQTLDILSKALEEKNISKKDILAHSVWTADAYYSMYKKATSTKEKDKIIENFETSQLQISGVLEDIVFREESPEFRTEAMNTLISLFSQTITEKPFHNVAFNDLIQRTTFALYRANANDLLTDEIDYDEFNDMIFRALDFKLSDIKPLESNNYARYIEKAGGNADDIKFSGFEYSYSKGMSFSPNKSAKRLLRKLENTENDSKKQVISKILYQLEFGKIGISEDGVKYLEKMYDLGEMNNPDYFVNRLTGKGDIGVFDENQVLQGYFNIGELTNEEEIVKPEVMEFTYETLFYSREGETEEEKQKREKYLQEFKESYFDFYDDEFVKKTGTRFNNLDFKEQGEFLIYYKNASEEKRGQLMNFIAEHKENGLKTFLSIEQGGQEMGEKIVFIGENLDQQNADIIFAKYAQMVDSIDKFVIELVNMYKDIFYKKTIDKEILVDNLLKEAKSVLINVYDRLEKGDMNRESKLVQELFDNLRRVDNINNKAIQDIIETYSILNNSKKELIKNLAEQDIRLLLNKILGDPDLYKTPQELNKAIESGEIEAWWMDDKWRKEGAVDDEINYLAKKMDKFVIQKMMEMLQIKIVEDEEYLQRGLDEDYQNYAKNNSVPKWFREMMQGIKEKKEQMKKIQDIFEVQESFEELFDNITHKKGLIITTETVFARVIQKYQELIEQAKKSKAELKILFSDNTDLANEDIDRISGSMLEKAQKFLDNFLKRIAMGENIDAGDTIKKIESMSADVELFKATAKNVRESGGSLEQLNSLQTITLDGKEISRDKQMIDKMKEMYRANYEKYPKLQALLVDSIDKKLADPDVQFHFSIHKNEKTGEQVITFLTTKQQDDDSIYFGSFNTDNEVFGGASLGLALAEEVFAQKEQKGIKKIEAHSVPQEGINNIYINRYHFVADGLAENYEDTGVDLFHITRKEKNQKYYYQNEISSEKLKKDILDSVEQVDEGINRFILKFKSGEEIAQLSKQIFEKGFVLTKYDIDKETKNIYCGFEKKGNTI